MPAEKPRLSRQVQCRFTDRQFELLSSLADELERPLSAIVREIVTVWAVNERVEQNWLDGVDDDPLDVTAMVAELQALAEES